MIAGNLRFSIGNGIVICFIYRIKIVEWNRFVCRNKTGNGIVSFAAMKKGNKDFCSLRFYYE